LQEYEYNITVNCIEPGGTGRVPFDEALKIVQGDSLEWKERKNAHPHDVAEIILFLCSEAARFISGSHIRLPSPCGRQDKSRFW